jgi:hypothetical protein
MALAPRILAAALALSGHMAAQAAMELTTPGPVDGTGVARGVVLIRCAEQTPNTVRQSRGTVLDLGRAATDADVVLTTAHGLLEADEAVRRDCLVYGVHGRPYRIEHVRRAPDRAGTAADWAVLLLKGRLEGDVGRLVVGRASGTALSELATERAPVRLLLRQAPLTDGDCRLLPLEPPYGAADKIIVYSCRLGLAGVPGLSGSPILVGHEGETLVIAIHLGWTLLKLDDGRLHVVSMARPIDERVAAAIAAASAGTQR